MHEMQQAGARHPGRISGEVLRGATGPESREYHIVYRFTDATALMAWETSPERLAILARLRPLMIDVERQPLTGLEAWFDVGGSRPPSRARMALVTWIGIWPIVSLALWQLVPRLDALPFLARTAVATALVVTIMTWAVMPVLAALFDPWLRRGSLLSIVTRRR